MGTLLCLVGLHFLVERERSGIPHNEIALVTVLSANTEKRYHPLVLASLGTPVAARHWRERFSDPIIAVAVAVAAAGVVTSAVALHK